MGVRYRWLKKGEIIRGDDEIKQDGKWRKVEGSLYPANIGIEKYVPGNWIRRPLKSKVAQKTQRKPVKKVSAAAERSHNIQKPCASQIAADIRGAGDMFRRRNYKDAAVLFSEVSRQLRLL